MHSIKKVSLSAIILFFILSGIGITTGYDNYSYQDVSVKAGPTNPGEELALPWVEVFIAPKEVDVDGDFLLSVSLAGKVKKVLAQIDQLKEQPLSSDNLTRWNGIFKLPKNIKSGIHFVKFTIIGNDSKEINRTLAFRAYRNINIDKNDYAYPVTIKNDTNISRNKGFKAGQNVQAIYKQTYFYVKGGNGLEGWVREEDIGEPLQDIYFAAYRAFAAADYNQAIALYKKVIELDSGNANAHYWLAKAYEKVQEDEKTIEHLKMALEIDPFHEGANWKAGSICRDYFQIGKRAAAQMYYKRAVEIFEQIVALRPASISYRVELGKTYEKLGQKDKSQEVFKQILLYDPDNQLAHQLLNTNYYKLLADQELMIDQAEKDRIDPSSDAPPNKIAQKYINLVKGNRTGKGTLVGQALRSVISMTKSLGTPIYEDGWKTSLVPEGFLVTYACRQERLGKFEAEDFTFKVDLDSLKVTPWNNNAKLLMLRW